MLEGSPGDFDVRMHSSIIEREVGIEVKMTLEAGDDNTRGGSVYNTECCDG